MKRARVVQFTEPSADTGAAGNPGVEWRRCEHCGCNTNARQRICCAKGLKADRDSWDRSALDP